MKHFGIVQVKHSGHDKTVKKSENGKTIFLLFLIIHVLGCPHSATVGSGRTGQLEET